ATRNEQSITVLPNVIEPRQEFQIVLHVSKLPLDVPVLLQCPVRRLPALLKHRADPNPVWAAPNRRTIGFLRGHAGQTVRGKMTPNEMNAAIPERRPATEE